MSEHSKQLLTALLLKVKYLFYRSKLTKPFHNINIILVDILFVSSYTCMSTIYCCKKRIIFKIKSEKFL
jgi:hypothetical protein